MIELQNVRDLLATALLGVFSDKGEKLVSVKSSQTVGDAMQKLNEAKVLSVPVSNSSTGEFVGAISVADLLRMLVDELGLSHSAAQHELTEEQVVLACRRLAGKTVDSCKHTGDLWFVEGANPTVFDAVKEMMGGDAEVHHRLYMCKSLNDTAPMGLVSQWDVVKMIWDHKVEMGEILTKTVAELNLDEGVAFTVAADVSALDALLMMYRDHKSCVGIVDHEGGNLIGNMSMSDLRGLTPATFPALMQPVAQFLRLVRGLPAYEGNDWGAALKPLNLTTVTPNTPFGEVLHTLVDKKLHRLYVVGEAEKVAGIITLTDVLRLVVPKP